MRGFLWAVPILFAACAQPSGDPTTSSSEQAVSGHDDHDRGHDDHDCGGGGGGGSGSSGYTGFADVLLTHADADILQTSNTQWSLTKTGSVNTTTDTVTWTISSAQLSVTKGLITVDGDLGLINIGTGPATLGNIVVNLQQRVAFGWHTISSDMADATHDIDATNANVVAIENDEFKGSFQTNAASGKLYFLDRATNTVFALVPEKTLAPFTDTPLLFAATFDNTVLKLADHSDIRVEVIVTFGNHAAGPPFLDGHNIDINGNGIIDPDEKTVRSVPNIWDRLVPKTQAANTSLAISDTPADISTMGTVTVTGETFMLPTTVTATVTPGAAGGSVTNCAHGTGAGITDQIGSNSYVVVAPADLLACDTETIHQAVCAPGAPGCGWHDGDLTTYGQVEWGDDTHASPASASLEANFFTVFASSSDLLVVGQNAAGEFTMTFTQPDTVITYLPASGTPAALNASLLDPTSSASGTFGGQAVALELNLAFGDAGDLPSSASLRLGDLHVCGITDLTQLNNLTVRDFQSLVNTLLAGGSGVYSIAQVAPYLVDVNMAFDDGAVSTFAQQHLVNGACP